MSLYLKLQYNVEKDSYKEKSNIIKDKRKEIVSEFLRTQIGAGKDDSPVNEVEVYEIELHIIFDPESYECKSNCNNLSLRDGILMNYIQSKK